MEHPFVDLKDAVKKDVSGDYATLLDALLVGNRTSSSDYHQKQKDNVVYLARELIYSGEILNSKYKLKLFLNNTHCAFWNRHE